MKCEQCMRTVPQGAKFCPQCGNRLSESPQKRSGKKRGNGQGSAYKENGKWTVCKTLGYEVSDGNRMRRIIAKKKGFATKKEALEYLPQLSRSSSQINRNITFKQIKNLWEESYIRLQRSKSTLNCYRAAFKYFAPIHFMKFCDITIEDLQDCIDDCEKGRRTRENMKACAGLIYKYAIPRGYLEKNLNLASFIIISRDDNSSTRIAFSPDELDAIRQGVGRVPYADFILAACYTSFRPSELLQLDVSDYNRSEHYIVGGSKTEAGTNRVVTISPKVQHIFDRLAGNRKQGPIFSFPDGSPIPYKRYREECFYPALERLGIDNPINPDTGAHRLTPHCCRHTFATLIKPINAPDKDKLELMGHTSTEMLQHYQHVNLDDLRRITDNL